MVLSRNAYNRFKLIWMALEFLDQRAHFMASGRVPNTSITFFIVHYLILMFDIFFAIAMLHSFVYRIFAVICRKPSF